VGSFQYTLWVKRRAAQRRDGRGTSLGNTLQPVGTLIVSAAVVVNHSLTSAMLSQYSLAADAAVP
jgi:hypothetical protein